MCQFVTPWTIPYLKLEVVEHLFLGAVVHEGEAKGLQVNLVPKGTHNLPEVPFSYDVRRESGWTT